MDFHVESCEKNDGKIQNLVGENGYGPKYKSTIKVQLWTPLWPTNFTWACMHFALAKINACSHQICPNVGHICIWPCDNHQSLSRWFL